MKRRQWLKSVVSAPVLAAVLPAAAEAQQQPSAASSEGLALSAPDAVADGTSAFFTAGESATLEALARIIFPATDSRPGAVEAGVPRFLDFLISQSPADRKRLYREGLASLDRRAQREFSKPFASLTLAEANRLLAPLEQPWTFAAPADPLAQFLRAAKDDILQATFNSREWAATGRGRIAAGTSYYYFAAE